MELGLRAASLFGYFYLLRAGSGPEAFILIILGSVEAVVLLVMGIGLAVLARQSMRRLPSVPAGPESWSAPAR